MAPVIGLAIGRGTGAELAAVFERVLARLGQLYATEIDVTRSPRIYHSYSSLRREGGIERIRRLTQEDAEHYELFCRTQARHGVPAIFRTAINAQSLYLVRQRLQAVKVDVIAHQDTSLLLVRDEAQGFYTGENSHSPGTVTRTMSFSREITEKVVSFALRRARQEWPDRGIGQVLMAYKFHLLDGALDEWVAEISERHGTPIRLCQPDTVNRNLIERDPPERTVIIAGNEWADIMHVVLLDRFGSERQESRCTENIHLRAEVAGLTEYQTVHGSADDLEGRDAVNPVATVRAAAAIAERHAGCAGAVRAVERALRSVAERGIRTADLGGRHTTTAVVDALLDVLEPAEPDHTPLTGRTVAAEP
ncbi:isocitrate/isopropylmalate family dehydrogenase [Goodfellowiella coeruleoviolacea]|uniref:Isocitrate/isopropylmalate dehydrogenase n=1 Tax=Goodfellowiella coeruleoviolacea TaxID=334858 RepID=A0AAE3GMI9_9PSEU|nr:isocitrate/isopropylmalate family dehydrogenase [Goodfellowiella coeruleoviolacea]MCP2170144.1 Isocitrate/isopropylmalate dehydrogenase [Goodfellowiella coeruleoviolacea]